MWRFVQKGLQCGKKAKASFVVICPDDVQPDHPIKKATWVIQSSRFHSSYEDSRGDGDGCREGNKWRINTFQDWNWFHQSYCSYLEAMGWGSAVIAGIQITDLYHRSFHLHSPDLDKKCWLQAIRSNVSQIDWSQINNLVGKCSSFAVSFLSHTVLQSKYIIPPNRSSNSFKAPTVEVESASKSEVDSSKSASELQRHGQPIDPLEDHNPGLNSSFAPENLASFTTNTTMSDDVWLHMVKELRTSLQQNLVALELARRGDLSRAVLMWSKVCESAVHDKLSLFNLAICYQEGLGVERDLEKAAELYAKASDLGHAKSAYNLALLFMKKSPSDENIDHAMNQLERASDLGLKDAQRELGVLYTELPRRDMKRAVQLFEKASAQQDASATYFLGICFEHGWGVPQDESKAASLYKLSSKLGCREAWYNLAVFFENGTGGLPLDRFEAVHCYQEAAKAGVFQAAEKLRILKQDSLLAAVVGANTDVKDNGNAHPAAFTPDGFGHNSNWFPLFSSSANSDSDGESVLSCTSSSDGSCSSTSTSFSNRHQVWQYNLHHSSADKPLLEDVIDKTRRLLETKDDIFPNGDKASRRTVSSKSLDNVNDFLRLGGSFGKVSLSNGASCR